MTALEVRRLGRTEMRPKALGLGGGYLGDPERTDEEAVATVRGAIDMGINFIDTSGLEMLRRVNESLRLVSVKLHLSEVKGPVVDRLVETAFAKEISGQMFFTTDEAMQIIDQETAREIVNP